LKAGGLDITSLDGWSSIHGTLCANGQTAMCADPPANRAKIKAADGNARLLTSYTGRRQRNKSLFKIEIIMLEVSTDFNDFQPSRDEAVKFLNHLGCTHETTRFRAVPQRPGCQVGPQCLPGNQFNQLFELNRRGAGVFVVVNATTGDKDEHVTNIRAVFVDLDGVPLEPVLEAGLSPHLIVETSPGHYQAYWKVSDCKIIDFTPLQRALAKRFGGDNSVVNLSRIMRLPGFYHLKGDPFLIRIISVNDQEAYTLQKVVSGLELTPLLNEQQEKQSVNNGVTTVFNSPEPCSDDEVIERAKRAENGDKFSWLFDGKGVIGGKWQITPEYPSQSEADLALVGILAFYSQNEAQLERLFERSPLGQTPKDNYKHRYQKKDYVKRTIRKALEQYKYLYDVNLDAFRNNVKVFNNDNSTVKENNLEFPYKVMAGFAGNFARIYADCLEPPIQFFYMSSLTVLGNLISGKATIDSEISSQPRFYTLLLGQSADDRKSTAINKTVEFFKQHSMNPHLNICHGIGSAEGLQKRFGEVIPDNGIQRLLVVYDEFKAFVGKCRAEGSILLPCVNTLFENNQYENVTKVSSVVLKNAHFSVLAASTLDTFQSCWTSNFTDIGFNNRLFIVTGEGKRKYSIPPRIDSTKLSKLGAELREVFNHIGQQRQFPITDEALKIYDNWYLNLESSIHTKRLDAYAIRFMTVLAANECKKEVDSEIVNKAISLCNWQLRIRQLHDPIDADNSGAKLEESIRRALGTKGPLTTRELKRATNANRFGLFLFQTAVKNLTAAGELTCDRNGKYSLAEQK